MNKGVIVLAGLGVAYVVGNAVDRLISQYAPALYNSPILVIVGFVILYGALKKGGML